MTTQLPLPTPKAAIYLRVSTDEQVNGYGLDVQRTRCEAMALSLIHISEPTRPY